MMDQAFRRLRLSQDRRNPYQMKASLVAGCVYIIEGAGGDIVVSIGQDGNCDG